MPSEVPLGLPPASAWIETSPMLSHVLVVGKLMTHCPRMLSSDALPDLVGVNVVA